MLSYLFLFLALFLNVAANLAMKTGSNNVASLISNQGFIRGVLNNHFLIIGLFLFAFNIVFYIIALSKINLSVAYPIMTSGGILVITFLSFLFFKEVIDQRQIIGLLFLIIGILLVTLR